MRALGEFVWGSANWVFKIFVLTQLWAWFVAPKFDLPAITLIEMAGLDFFYSLFTFRITTIDIKIGKLTDDEETTRRLAWTFIPATAWASGAILRAVM